MPIKPYSFRFPYDIRTTWDALQKKFVDALHGLDPEYSVMLNRMSDRDRALEDYLTLGVGQGYLGVAYPTSPPVALTNVFQNIAGMTNTVNLPAGRRLKVIFNVYIVNLAGVTGASEVQILDENNNLILYDSYVHAVAGAIGDTHIYTDTIFIDPLPGTHTYRLQARIATNNGSLVSAPGLGFVSFTSIEDVGPANR